MARQTFSPQHDISGPAIFISESDSAWDHDRIKAEIRQMRIDAYKAEGDDDDAAAARADKAELRLADFNDPARQHPFARYIYGDTRYDIQAEGIADYLDKSKAPEMWRLRPMGSYERAEVDALDTMRGEEFARHRACMIGLVGAEGAQGKIGDLLKRREDGKDVSDKEITDALDALALNVVGEIGVAVRLLSRDLSEQEKKL